MKPEELTEKIREFHQDLIQKTNDHPKWALKTKVHKRINHMTAMQLYQSHGKPMYQEYCKENLIPSFDFPPDAT